MCLTMLRRLRSRKRVFVTVARFHPTRGLLSSFLLVALSACAGAQQPVPPTRPEPARPALVFATQSPESAPVRVAPTRPDGPKLWPVTTWRGVEYVDVRDLARRFGLKADWTKSGPVMRVGDNGRTRFSFEEKQRDFYFDGLRIFLGEAVIREKDSLWVSKIDVIKIVVPLIRPGEYASQLPAAPRLIVIDPGHGGTDPGKQNLKLKLDEKNMTLDVSLRLKRLLEQSGFKVLLTREKDERFSNSPSIDLPLRVDFANKAGADLFVSIHFNAVDAGSAQRVSGTETYVLTPQHMVSSQAESDKSMQAIFNPGNRQDMANAVLGHHLHRQLVTGLRSSDRGYKRYRYAVLRTLNCPGALVEAAYLSNDTEARRVATPEYRQQIAQALATGIQNYSNALEALRPKPAEPEKAGPAVAPKNKEAR